MAHAAYPTADELKDFLVAAGLIADPVAGEAAYIDYTTAAGAASDEFERLTDRTYLLPGTTATRYYDPPFGGHRLVPFYKDLLSAPTPTVVMQSLLGSPSTLTVDRDYILVPQNAPADGRPYTGIVMYQQYWATLAWSYQGALRVTGKWAYATTIPDDVYQAILMGGAIKLLPVYATLYSRGMVSWTEASVTENYGPDPFGKLKERWSESYQQAVRNYKRTAVGL